MGGSDDARINAPGRATALERPPQSARRGRGAVSNPSGRYETARREGFDDGWEARWDSAEEAAESSDALRTELSIDSAKSVISRNTSPDVPFDRSINPYRGCEHGCVYCFARPTHAWLGLSPGLDFESKILVKPQAAALLRRELGRRGYRPAPIAIGTNTDPYQPVERTQGVMRAVLEVLSEARHPVTIVTKGALVTRDLDILSEMAADGLARAALSVTTLDPRLARAMEPRASSPSRRLAAISALAAAKVPVGVMTAPIIPGLNDHEIEAILTAAAQEGANWSDYVALRMPLEIKGMFRDWLEERYPNRAAKVLRGVRELHGGRDYDPEWGKRMRGEGTTARLIALRHAAASRRLGLDAARTPLRTDLFRPPATEASSAQMRLDL